jgi:hypothetical protein
MPPALRRELGTIDGFVSVECFGSLTEPGKLLSLSLGGDEATLAAHRSAPVSSPTTGCASPA